MPFDCSKEIKALETHKRGVSAAMARAAKAGANLARDEVVAGAPEKTKALKTAVYVVTQEASGAATSDYYTQLAAAEALNPNIERAGQALPPIPVPASKADTAWAGLSIAVSYGDLLIEGYHKGGREVPPNDFWNPAIGRADRAYQALAQAELDAEVTKLESK